MEENQVEQIASVRCVKLLDNLHKSNTELMDHIESAYSSLHYRAKSSGKVLIGVNQTITCSEGVYIITLVGSVVDAQLVEQQKRLQQFGMGQANTRPRGVN